MADVTDLPEYEEGKSWAKKNVDRLRELFTGTALGTQELRSVLWGVAQKLYPEQRDSMENDLRATAWVAGAIYPLATLMEWSPQGMSAIFEISMEMGSIFNAERTKAEAFEDLKEKPASWWSRKIGDASPNEIMKPIYMKWWRDIGNPGGKRRTTKWEALKHVMGARELRAFVTMKKVTLGGEGGIYVYYDVDGEDSGFQIMAKDAVHEDGIVSQRAGDIVG